MIDQEKIEDGLCTLELLVNAEVPKPRRVGVTLTRIGVLMYMSQIEKSVTAAEHKLNVTKLNILGQRWKDRVQAENIDVVE